PRGPGQCMATRAGASTASRGRAAAMLQGLLMTRLSPSGAGGPRVCGRRPRPGPQSRALPHTDFRMSERYTERLRAGTEPAWTRAVEHRFVRELCAGSVDDAVLANYLVQD